MELRDLRYFVHIAELGSFTRAGQSLNIAQPSLTRHMQKLEEHLGVAVFTRVNRGVRLTEAGRRLLDRASRILRDVDQTRLDVSVHASAPSGKVTLGVPPTLCPVLLPQLIARMRKDYPAVELEITPAGSMVLPEWLRAGRLDLAVMAEISPSRLLIAKPLLREEMVMVLPPSQAGSGPIQTAELAATPLIVTEAIRTITNNLLTPYGVTLRTEMILNSLETIRLMVQDGTCATILPYSITSRDHAMKLVSVRRLMKGDIQRQLVLATPEGHGASQATDATAKMLRGIADSLNADGVFAAPTERVTKRAGARQQPRRR